MSKIAVALNHYEGWKMPEEMEAYSDAFAIADKAARKIRQIITLIQSVSELMESGVEIGAIPTEWPSLQELRSVILAANASKKHAISLWKSVPVERQKRLTSPDKIGR